MQKLKILLLAVLFSSSALFAAHGDVFIGAAVGSTNINTTQNDKTGSIILAKKLADNGYNLTLDAGYFFQENIDVSLSYQRANQKEFSLNNFSIASQYRFQRLGNITPILGANIGYSILQWDEKLIDTIDNDFKSGSFLLGAKVGASYLVMPHIDLNIYYQLQHMNHSTKLASPPASSELVQNYMHNINIGIRYIF